jgi:endonuclease/exonuclease/phosphatase family metal-dependent hydrolase
MIRLLLLAGMLTTMSANAETIRVATFNVSLHFPEAGELTRSLAGGDYAPAHKIAAVIQTVRPDILLLNEFDYEASGEGVGVFKQQYLGVGQFGLSPIDYPYGFVAPVNTGVSSGVDLNGDGRVAAPADAHGFGLFPGQYGMLVLSRYPIDTDNVRTFQKFLWRDLKEPNWPRDPETDEHFYSEAAREVLRLSSKSHWDVPIQAPGGVVHLLASHPTPPVFDGPENRNGLRNFDEIRFWSEYLSAADYLIDDQGRSGGLAPGAHFVIAGDLNADPLDGDSVPGAVDQLLQHPRVSAAHPPTSEGAVRDADEQGGVNSKHQSDSAADTADFGDAHSGNLRADYVLPSVTLTVDDCGVFWPAPGQPGRDWLDASDHRMAWIDLHF